MKKTSKDKINELHELRAKALEGGGLDKIEKHKKSGKMTARERVQFLLDEGSFIELYPFREHDLRDFEMDKKKFPGDGVVVGYGTINGRTVYVFSHDFTILGGSLGEAFGSKDTK